MRHARLRALLAAFALGTPQSFAEGAFLAGAPRQRYPKSSGLLQGHGARPSDGVPTVPPRLFWWLLRYRGEAEQLIAYHSGLLEAGLDGVSQGVHVTLEATARVQAAMSEVDALLHEMISPDDQKIPLANIPGWPDVDVENLEREERWGL